MGANTFKEMVQGYTAGLSTPVDEIVEGNPLFQTSLWGPSNNGFSHKYKELVDIQTADAVNLNSAYPTIGADFNLKDRDLAFFAGTREEHVNTVQQLANGDFMAYLDEEMTPIFNSTLNNISFDFYYNVLRPFAKAKGKLVSATESPSGEKYYSMYFVRWQQGQMQGLVNDKWASSNGGVFTVEELSGGSRYKSPTSGKSVYGIDIEMPIGFLPVNGRNVSGIVNIDLDTIDDKTLGTLVRKQLVEARPGAGGNVVGYGNPQLISRIGQMDEAQQLGTANNGIFGVQLNGVTLVGDWNLLNGTEAAYTL